MACLPPCNILFNNETTSYIVTLFDHFSYEFEPVQRRLSFEDITVISLISGTKRRVQAIRL